MKQTLRSRIAANKTGRSKYPDTFVKLENYLLRSDAYRSLKPIPRTVYTELRRRFNGRNNCDIICSVRQLAKELHCSKDSAGAALRELQEKGFIKVSGKGSFNYKLSHASTWILTEESLHGAPPTKEFTRWRAPEQKAGPEIGTAGPQIETASPKKDRKSSQPVLKQGPCAVYERGSRSR